MKCIMLMLVLMLASTSVQGRVITLFEDTEPLYDYLLLGQSSGGAELSISTDAYRGTASLKVTALQTRLKGRYTGRLYLDGTIG